MRKFFERASSTERRFVTVVFMCGFLLLNWLFVWPHAGDWTKFDQQRSKALRTLKLYEDGIAQAESLKPKVDKLQGEGSAVPAEDQFVRFNGVVQSQAAASGITLQNLLPATSGRTNQFFVEKALTATFTTEEDKLVDFLYKLGTGESLVRVRGLSLHPDPPRNKLQANLTLVASYQKKMPVRGAAAPATSAPAPAPAVKPAAAPVTQSKTNPPAKLDKAVSARPAPEKTATKKPAPGKPTGPGAPKPSTPIKKTP